MFNVYISDSVYDRIISTEEKRATAGRSNLYKLLMERIFYEIEAIKGVWSVRELNDKYKEWLFHSKWSEPR